MRDKPNANMRIDTLYTEIYERCILFWLCSLRPVIFHVCVYNFAVSIQYLKQTLVQTYANYKSLWLGRLGFALLVFSVSLYHRSSETSVFNKGNLQGGERKKLKHIVEGLDRSLRFRTVLVVYL